MKSFNEFKLAERQIGKETVVSVTHWLVLCSKN